MTKKILLILLLAAVLRFWNLGSYPALNADEAALGYNAYSLLKTGLDEHGNSWPIHFQSFNDYKPGLYVYLVLPFIKVFGLTEAAVRFPGAILGVASVWLIYLLAKELKFKDPLPILSSLLLTISPWHIHFSRGAWEVNLATFLITAGSVYFLKGIKKKNLLIVSAVLFVLSLYAYHAARVVVPLLLLGFAIVYKRVLFKGRKMLIPIFIGVLLLIPLGVDFFRSNLGSRASGVGIFADSGPVARINEQRGEHSLLQGVAPYMLHNKVVNYGLAFLENWAKHFDGEFLFVSGDEIQRNKVPETGLLYLFEIFTMSIGIFTIARGWGRGDGKNSPNFSPILVWVLVAPVAAALTFQSPHSLRSHNIIIPLTLIGAVGLTKLLHPWDESNSPPRGWVLFVALVLIWSFVRYQIMYWGHMAKEYPFSSQYGVKELVEYLKGDTHEKVFITTRYDQPYILFLFYSKYPPLRFQNEHILTPRDKYGFSTVESFDRYKFRQIDYEKIKKENTGSLIVGTDEEIPEGANVIKEIFGQNGYLYFQIVKN